MKNSQPFLPVLLAVLALTSPLCLAAGQDMQNDSSLVAVGSVPEETGEQAEPVSQPPMQFAELGGADASGGNFVGDELLDDYESRGTTKLTSAEIVSTLQPLTERLAAKVSRSQRAGRVDDGVSAIAAASALVAMMERMAAFHTDLEPLGATRDDVVETTARIVYQVVMGEPSAPTGAR